MSAWIGSAGHRHNAKWTYLPGVNDGQVCPMVTKTKRRCVRGKDHYGRHATVPLKPGVRP